MATRRSARPTSRRVQAEGGSRRSAAASGDDSRKSRALERSPSGRSPSQGGGGRPSSQRLAAASSGSSRKSTRSSKKTSARGSKTSRKSSTRTERGSSRISRRHNPVKDRIVAGVIIGLVVILVGGALAWPGFQRSRKLAELEATQTREDEERVAREFIDLVERSPDRVHSAIASRRGSVRAQIYMAEQLELVADLLQIAQRPDTEVDDDLRARAVASAADLYDSGRHKDVQVLDSRLTDWALQPERDKKHQGVAEAAIAYIAKRGEKLAGKDPAEVLYTVITDPGQDATIVDAASEQFHKLVHSANVGFALNLLASERGFELRADERLIVAVQQALRTQHLPRVFELLETDSTEIQALGAKLLQSPNITTADPAMAEDIGRRIGPFLDAEDYDERRAVFTEALNAVARLRLVGARDQLLALLSVVPVEAPESRVLADTLGRQMISTDGDDAVKRSEQILASLTSAIDQEEPARSNAARSLQKIEGAVLPALRDALEACIRHGEEPDCFTAAAHIVKDLYERADVTQKLGTDLEAWERFLANDRPRFEEFGGIRKWLGENAEVRTTDDPEKIRGLKVRVAAELDKLKAWVDPKSKEPMPLGLVEGEVKALIRDLEKFKYSVMKATPGL